ncbi:proline--tRNA ligase, partial [bacterium]|nr:proline--tRNA ligase [bacterium]
VEKVTGAKVGYAGIVNLPNDVEVFIDDSIEPLINFETGGNRTDYHLANVNWGRDLQKPKKFHDLKVAKSGDLYPETSEEYEAFKASEVGNIFPLMTKFTDAVDYQFVDADGKSKPVYMGSYGIGTSRLLGVIAEKFHDDKGMIWPESVAPYKVHLIALGENAQEEGLKIYETLTKAGVEVMWDDRGGASAGEKFNDADLIGLPYRIVVSQKSLEKGGYEVKKRTGEEIKYLNLNSLIELTSR